LILAGVLLSEEQEKLLKKEGVKDSKQLAHPARIRLAEVIRKNSISSKIVMACPMEIDSSINSGTNLNTLEAVKTAEVINALNDGAEKIKVVVDCPSVNIMSWRNTLLKFVRMPENLEISCEHKADVHHPAVSAASILAKVAREEEVAKIKEQFKEYGNIGSGYPSDPDTKEFLKKNGNKLKDSGIFRKTWATWKALFPEAKQSPLNI
jgi:ribonuclease HII